VVRAPVGLARAGEPPREEWFLEGTEPPGPARLGDHRPPRIVAPVPGTRIALDPDIPPARQRVAFEAAPASAGLRWVLDGADAGGAASLVLWAPRAGRHRLQLVDADGRVRATATFEVRGAATRGSGASAPSDAE
jgi:penicillin-binding protein 1C